MRERVTFVQLESDGSYTDNTKLWAYVEKDGFTRSETDDWFRIIVRDHKSLYDLLQVGNRMRWNERMFSIFSWEKLAYDKRNWVEIIVKQIADSDNVFDGELFPDIVSVYRMEKIEQSSFGITSYSYQYDFDNPLYTGIKCRFDTNRNRYLDDSKLEVEHDSLIVRFNKNADIKDEDFIISPIHGKFKVDMVVKDENDMIQVYVTRTEVQ
jgi:hypothetical protein